MSAGRWVRGTLKVLLPLLLLAAGGVGFVKLVQSRQAPPRKPRPQLGPLVRVQPVAIGDVPVVVTAFGTVQPVAEIDVTPRVSGEAVEVSPHLVSGGFLAEGEVLLRIDPRDYELAVEKARAEVERARFEIVKAREEAAAARNEWESLYAGQGVERPGDDSLVFHGPHLKLAEANRAAAKARLEEEELALERTVVRAPFAARVRSEALDRGQLVTAGRSVARIYATDAAEIVFPVPDGDLGWLTRSPGKDGPRVTVRAEFAGRAGVWTGRIVRTEGVVDEKTRTVNLVARVEEPYANPAAPLTVGLFVTGELQGRTLRRVASVPRGAVREGDTVWVADEQSRLRIRPVTVARSEGPRVYIAEGLAAGERLVVSRLDAATEGMEIRVAEEP
jgi:RND family efflux transporter MFP subunit